MADAGTFGTEPYYEHVRSAYDNIANEYDETVGNYAVSQRAKRLALKTIADLTPRGGKLLDIGCYTGIEAFALARQGYKVTGVDLSPAMVGLAKEKARKFHLEASARFQAMKASDISALKGTADPPFDSAYSVYGTLNLEPRIDQFKQSLFPLLKEKGAFICGLLNPTVLYELAVAPFLLKFHGFAKLTHGPVKTRIGLGTQVVDAFLYTPRRFAEIMKPEFKLESVTGLHLFYPPPRRRGGLDLWWMARAFDAMERRVAERPLFASLGFFSLLVFRKL